MSQNFSSVIQKARQALDTLGCKEAYEILSPLLAENNPEAIYLYSTFSVSENENIEEFESRSISLLQKAASLGYAPAIYTLAINYEYGDLIEIDQEKAAFLYKLAADIGYPEAIFHHGVNLFYGAHGIEKNIKLGLELVKKAVNLNVDGASSELDHLLNKIE